MGCCAGCRIAVGLVELWWICGWPVNGWDDVPDWIGIRGGSGAEPIGRGGAPKGCCELLGRWILGGTTLGVRDLDLLVWIRRCIGGRLSSRGLGLRLTGLGSCMGSGGSMNVGLGAISV